MLLLHGVHADRPDKHGVTPEMVARESGRDDTADVLREWLANKDKDLKEREDTLGVDELGHAARDRKPSSSHSHHTFDSLELSVRKRLNMKRSVEHTLKPPHGDSRPPPHDRRPSYGDPPSPLGDYLFYNEAPYFDDDHSRRPSFPQVFDEPNSLLALPPGLQRHGSINDDELPPSQPPPTSAPRKLGSQVLSAKPLQEERRWTLHTRLTSHP